MLLSVIPFFEDILNRYIALDPETHSQLKLFTGKLIAVEVIGFFTVYLQFTDDAIQLSKTAYCKPDLSLKGRPADLLLYAITDQRQRHSTLFSGKIEISGDIHLAESLQHFFKKMDIDWEGHLASFTNNSFAHVAGNAFRRFTQWNKKNSQRLAQTLTEFIQEEVRLFPSRIESEIFYEDVANLRLDVDRLEARIRRLYSTGEFHIS